MSTDRKTATREELEASGIYSYVGPLSEGRRAVKRVSDGLMLRVDKHGDPVSGTVFRWVGDPDGEGGTPATTTDDRPVCIGPDDQELN